MPKSHGPRPVWNPPCPACSHTLTKASDACQIFAARARIVSGSQIRLNMSRDIHGRMLAREPCPLIRAFSAERPHQNEHHRKSGEKPKMHPPFEFGLARPSPITVIDQERSQHTCERDEDQPGPAHSGLSLPKTQSISYSKRTKRKAIAIIRRSCSDSVLTARPTVQL